LTVAAGASTTVRIELGRDALAFSDVAMQWMLEPGTVVISAGNSSNLLKSGKLVVS